MVGLGGFQRFQIYFQKERESSCKSAYFSRVIGCTVTQKTQNVKLFIHHYTIIHSRFTIFTRVPILSHRCRRPSVMGRSTGSRQICLCVCVSLSLSASKGEIRELGWLGGGAGGVLYLALSLVSEILDSDMRAKGDAIFDALVFIQIVWHFFCSSF